MSVVAVRPPMALPVRVRAGVVVTCVVAAVSYLGAVRAAALPAFVIPSLLLAAAFAAHASARGKPATALAGGVAVALALAELVNVVTGTSYGPAARSSFVAAAGAVFAVVAASSRFPAAFLVGIAVIVVGALALGAGGEVRLVAVATTLASVLVLAGLERSGRRWGRRPHRSAAIIVVPLLLATVAALVAVLQTQHDSHRPVTLDRTVADSRIKPTFTDPLPKPKPVAGPEQRRKHTPTPGKVHRRTSSSLGSDLVWGLLGFVLAVLAGVVARLVVVRRQWWRLRRSLLQGETAIRIVSAWRWTQLQLAARRMALPAAMSPDLATSMTPADLPETAVVPLHALARLTSQAAFSADIWVEDRAATAAWIEAAMTTSAAHSSLTRWGRLRFAFVSPARVAARVSSARPRSQVGSVS